MGCPDARCNFHSFFTTGAMGHCIGQKVMSIFRCKHFQVQKNGEEEARRSGVRVTFGFGRKDYASWKEGRLHRS